MCKADYTIEDFVLDLEFRNWVLHTDKTSNIFWEDYLEKYPQKREDILLARKIVINMSRFTFKVDSERKEAARQNILKAIQQFSENPEEKKVVPIHSLSSLLKPRDKRKKVFELEQIHRIAGILLLAFFASFLINAPYYSFEESPIEVAAPEYEEHFAPPGIKSNLTLQDGSKVILNSGSRLKYLKNFEPDRREIELYGEAYFEVSNQPKRPFKVKTGQVTTIALGTSFNIKAFEREDLDISLVSGSVKVNIDTGQLEQVYLSPGEMVNIGYQDQQVSKRPFAIESTIAWTKKTIVFDHTSIPTIVRTLENWYGVHIHLRNKPSRDMAFSGRFHDQTLKNVLIGLSHSAGFEFKINKDHIYITFK
ncbi:FecR family protein [Pleomorphovibrio marinus]|uniref:FecR family protein n=1 Tax=Pleomorphovibrio marinus TaxID=2164132 RepID=UPI000E0BAA5A|nr:FecR domain-containing protein [Pleomorphovibrio marinus]